MVEAAGVVPRATFEGRRSKPRRVVDTRPSEVRDGGGGGSRTRVREYAVAALYMLSRSCMFATAVKERRKPAAASSDSSRRHASEQHVAASLLI